MTIYMGLREHRLVRFQSTHGVMIHHPDLLNKVLHVSTF